MSTQRISLNNSQLAGRLRKFDTYHYDQAHTERASDRSFTSKQDAPAIVQTQKPVPPVHVSKTSPSKNIVFKQTASYSVPKLSKQKSYIKLTHKKTSSSNSSAPYSQNHHNQQNCIQTSLLALNAVKKSRKHALSHIATQFGTPTAKRRKRSLIPESRAHKIFYSVGITVFMLACFTSVQTILTNRQAKEQLGVLGAQTQTIDENGVLEGTGDEPSEAPVPTQSILNYTVSPDMPRYIRIPSISVFSRVKQMGITREGAVDAPANINDAGWFNGSAKPGSAIGSSLIVAHVSGWTAPGAFKKINQLKPGMRFEIEKGSGEKLTYEVVRGESIPVDQVNMESILNPVEGEQHDLKLMTCSGRFNRQTDHYEDRYVVFAKILR